MPQKKDWEFELIREGEERILRIYCETYSRIPILEDDPFLMSRTIDILLQVKEVTKIVYYQKRDFEYEMNQVLILMEIANLYAHLTQNKHQLSLFEIGKIPEYRTWYAQKQDLINNLVFVRLKQDPIGAYVMLKRLVREARIAKETITDTKRLMNEEKYIAILSYVKELLERTRMIKAVLPQIPGYSVDSRDLYRLIFRPVIKPDFMYTKLRAQYPDGGEILDTYSIGDTEVNVFKLPEDVQYLYHLMPPEFRLTEEQYELLDTARNIMAEHKPTKSEFIDPERMREVFMNIGVDLLAELAETKDIKMKNKDILLLAKILMRYTIGFGLIEVLMEDEKIQDVTLNSPLGRIPMFIVHQDFGNCFSNIYPTPTESESWATKLRLISGRPLDEANPILDTELTLPAARTRVSAISPPLNPTGLAFAFRRHRNKPWTLPLFMKYKMFNPIAAGIISFLIDGTKTMLVAGTRSSGKSSVLASVMVDIMRRYRIITIEDTLELPTQALRELGFNLQSMKVSSALAATKESGVSATDGIRATLRMGDSSLIIGEVRSSLKGSEEVVIVENGLTKRMPIKDLENKNLKSFFVPTFGEEQKMKLKKLTAFVKHPKRKQLIKLTTKTGREVTVTPDHSVFTHVDFKIAAINTNQLKVGDPIIIPSKLPNGFNDIGSIDLLRVFKEDYRLENAEPYIRKAVKKLNWKKCSEICGISDIYRYLLSTQKTRIPIKAFLKLMIKAKIKFNLENLRIKRGTSNSIPTKFPINESVLRFIGYYLAEGNITNSKIQITNSKPEIIKDITQICEKELGLSVSKRKIKGYGTSIQMFVTCKPLADLLLKLDCGKTSFHKRIPEFVYGLNEKKICALLRGMYSGDGSISITKSAGTMIQYFSTSKKLIEDVAYALLSVGIVCRIHSRNKINKSHKKIYIAEIKQRKYVEFFLKNIGFTHKRPSIFTKSFSHSKDDSVSFNPKELEKHLKLPRKYRHLRRTKCCSKDYLKKITEEVKCSDEIYNFAHGEFFVDKVKSIEVINLKKPEYVYDLSVKSTQRFIGGFGGILLHNTEALALYEAMRVGAAANVVAGTIHADSPYGVFDRVVNDIGVPRTSFKATDIILMNTPVRSPDGLHWWRRMTGITEVRKDWVEDPHREQGFVDLLRYNPITDELEPSPDLMNGDSDVLKSIAANVKQWAGKWDAVWDNIMLRAKIRKANLDYSLKAGNPELLEAPFVIKCNDMFHIISENVLEEVGDLDSKMIYNEWERWLKKEVKKESVKK
ncbi:MAG: Flp pilus assembly complex ATPase component TadA [Nanoarchaeota archaeon]|nr:Flp pilus assembly complex ATPase component TadA [Nanoarchaeota archaeon]